MITKNLSTLKIHKLTKEQYERELESGNLDEHAIYLTPDEDMDLSNYATKAELAGKANKEHSHVIADIADLQTTLEGKTPYGHKHSAADLTSGTLSEDRLPIIPISKGGTGAETATGLLNNLGIAASANELNYVKGVTSGIQSQLDNKSPSTHIHDYAGSASPGGSATRAIGDKDGNEITATYETKEQSTKNLQAAKDHADTAAATVKAEILGGAEGAYDTLKELKELIDAGDSSAVEALQEVAAGKADKNHTHIVANIEDLQDVLDDKQDTITGAAASIISANLTGSRVLVSNISGKVAASNITDVELGYLDNATSNIQAQINQKFDKAGGNINGRVGVSGSLELNNGDSYIHFMVSRIKGGKMHSAGMLPSSDDGSTVIMHQTDGVIDNQLTLSPTATYLKQPLSVTSGGTGANNAASARTNLGITPANIGAAPSSHTHTIAQVTSLQDSLNAKQNVINGGASTITSSNLTTSRALVSNTDGKVVVSAVTSTELGYLDGVTANIQTQLDGKIRIGSFGNSNINALYDMGMYSIQAGSNCPSGAQYGVVLTMPYRKAYTNTKPDHGAQIYLPNGDDPTTPNDMFFRTSIANTWNSWNKVLHSNNYSSYALPITGGNLNGGLITTGSIWVSAGAEGDLGVDYKGGKLYFYGNNDTGNRGVYDAKYGGVITVTNTSASFAGNASTATTATTASSLSNAGTLTTLESVNNFITGNKLQYALFQLQSDIGVGFTSHDGMLLSIPWASTNYGAQIAIDDNATNPKIAIRGKYSSWGDWKILPFSDGTNASGTWGISITGNAASATKSAWLDINYSLTYGASGLNYFNINGTEGTDPASNVTPTSAYYHILRMNHGNPAGYFADIAVPLNDTNGVWWRQVRGGVNHGWHKILDSNNYSSYALPRSAGSSYPLLNSLYFRTNSWTGNIIADNASGQHRYEMFSGSSTGTPAQFYIRVFNNEAGTTYADYTFGTDGTLTATKFSGSLSGDASSAHILNVNNVESKSVGRLQFFQTYNNSTLLPDTGWWSLIRTQHAGYTNGYWQEMAYSFSSDVIKFRRNVNGSKTAWKTIAFTDSNITGNAATATNASKCNGVIPEWSGSIAWDDTAWIAAWTNDGTKIKCLNKTNFAPASHTHSYLPLSGGTMNSGARIGHGSSLYLGNADNSGWVYTQDIASQAGTGNWAINVAGSAWFKDVHIGGYTYPSKGSYALNTSSFYCQSWIRSGGDTGWFNETYGGGWYMNDTTWIRTYGGKNIYQNTGIMRTDGTLQVGADGAYFNASSSGTNVGGKLVVTYSGVGGLTIHGSGTTTGIQITRTDNNYGIRVGMSSTGAQGIWACDYNKSDTTSMIYMKPTDTNATTYIPNRIVMSGSYGTGAPPSSGTRVKGMIYFQIVS